MHLGVCKICNFSWKENLHAIMYTLDFAAIITAGMWGLACGGPFNKAVSNWQSTDKEDFSTTPQKDLVNSAKT